MPPEKRRIIVYAGFHPNEGTDVLSRKHAEEWAQKYNVLVVCQPVEETPHGFWKKQARLAGPDGVIPPLPDDVDFHYEDIEEKLSLGGETFFC